MADFLGELLEIQKQTLDVRQLSPRGQQDIVNEFRDDQRLQIVDLIWTAKRISCCIAVEAGWQYGIRSTDASCKYADTSPRTSAHTPVFVDNYYERYVHQTHLADVKKFRPKYATVRDIMTPEQCKEEGIEYFEFRQILDWAEELKQYAKEVILIPKYDCLDQIPDEYMLGYSILTSYGGTPIDIKRFEGRRVHLLGGSPNKQIAYWSQIPNSVISLDNNYIDKMANHGQMWLINGTAVSLNELNLIKNQVKGVGPEEIGFGRITDVRNICLAVSLSSFATYFRRQYIDQIDLFKVVEDQMTQVVSGCRESLEGSESSA